MEVSAAVGQDLPRITERSVLATMSGPTTATIKQLFAVSGNRCAFPGCDLHCAEHVAEVIQYEIADTVAAIILEPIVGAGGVIIPPAGYLQRVKEICEENDILFIADEIMTGFGRTGKWFGVQHWDLVPDLMTVAKGLTSSYVPLGAVAISDKISNILELPLCQTTVLLSSG